MELHITPKEQILRELEVIQACEEETISEEVSKVIEYGQTLAPYISRSGKLLADAKHHLNTRMKEDTFDALAIVDSLCADERYLVDFAERVNRCGVHRLDWCRTLISKAKEDMRLSGMQPT